MSKLVGPDFVALQVRDLAASAEFYETTLGLNRAPFSPPEAVVFDTQPIPFAIRQPMVELDSVSKLGHGVSLWFLTDHSETMLAQLKQAQVPILQDLLPSPFGQTFVFSDPDGYTITVHDRGNA